MEGIQSAHADRTRSLVRPRVLQSLDSLDVDISALRSNLVIRRPFDLRYWPVQTIGLRVHSPGAKADDYVVKHASTGTFSGTGAAGSCGTYVGSGSTTG
jgi:hypothetical protein